MTLNLLDIILIVVVAISVLVGFVRGFVREILSIVCWVLAFWVAFTFLSFGESLFEQHLPKELRSIVGFITLFIGTLLIVSIASAILYRLFAATGITGTDRTLGGLFGFLRAVLIISTFVALVSLTVLPKQQQWQESLLIKYFVPVSDMIIDWLPDSIRGQLKSGSDMLPAATSTGTNTGSGTDAETTESTNQGSGQSNQ